MKTLFSAILISLLLGLSHLMAQDNIFRYATSTTTNQVIDSILTKGTAVIPYGSITKDVAKTISIVENGNVSEERNYYINTSSLELDPTTYIVNTYNASNILSSKTTSNWNNASSTYVDSLKSEYEYPINDICIETIYEYINYTWVFKDSVKIITSYNENQDPIEEIIYASREGLWVDSLKITMSYDVSDRLTEKIGATYNGSEWINYMKTGITYNMDNVSGSAIIYNWDGSSWTPSTFTFQGYDATLSTTLTYAMVSRTTLPVINNIIETIKTYPNPADDGFYVKADNAKVNVEIISVNGKLILSKTVTGTQYIRVNTFPSGTYLVRLSTEGKSITKKLYIR